MGRTVAELEESMSAREWSDWLVFQALYDLPDGFFVVGQLGSLISRIMGGKGAPAEFVPYFRPDRQAHARASAGTAYALLQRYAKRPAKKSD